MKFSMYGFLGITLLSLSSVVPSSLHTDRTDRSELVVETTTGRVRGGYGGVTAGAGKPVYWYRSIPFAEPPVGDLRFAAPVPKSRWDGILDVEQKGIECVQGSGDNIRGAEDCLTVQVYTTSLPSTQKKKPVMIWTYGGAFITGSPDFESHSPDYLLDEDVIVVSLHYRVGILGFLSTGDMIAPGNNGLKDQVLALQWIKANIEKFGGDPDNITLFGQSAGGASVAYLLQSRHAKGLFNRAIMQSGSSLCLWSLTRVAAEMAKKVTDELNLPSTNSQAIVNSLKSVDVALLQKTAMGIMIPTFLSVNPRDGLLFAPVIEPNHEGAIVTKASHQQLMDGDFQSVPLIVGYNTLEARLETIPEALRLWLLTVDLRNSKLIPASMNVQGLLAQSRVGGAIKREYFGSSSVAGSNLALMRFISDDQFERPIQESIRLYSAKTPVYFYKFGHEGSLYGVQDRSISGVGHTEELGYIFNFGHIGTGDDYLVRNRVVKMWTNFAKTGNPTPTRSSDLQNIIWTPNRNVGTGNLQYLSISSDLEMSSDPNKEKMDFWNNIFAQNSRAPYDTY